MKSTSVRNQLGKFSKIILLLILLTSVLAPSPAFAKDVEQASATATPPKSYSDSELEKIANQIYNSTVSAEYTQNLYNSLTAKQRDVVTRRLAQLTNVSFAELKAEIASNQLMRPRSRGGLDNPVTLSPGYNVQMPYLGAGSNTPNVGLSSGAINNLCDSDPGDSDYIFYAYPPQNVSPSQMRWFSYSPLVTWALNTAYGSYLSTYGSNLNQINICLGTNGVYLAGGFSAVLFYLKVKYQ